MDSSIGHAGFRIGCFVVFVAGGLLLFLETGTAEQAITLITLLLGLLFLLAIAIVVRLGQRGP
jgi:hypothetical protein